MTAESKRFVIRAMEHAKDDSLERAEAEFRGMTDAELKQQHGQSGETRQQILDEYRAHRRQWVAAMREVETA